MASPYPLAAWWSGLDEDICTETGNNFVYLPMLGTPTGQEELTVQYSIPLHSLQETYFEIKVNSIGSGGVVAIGLANHTPRRKTLPGWPLGSYGYHSDDGNFFDEYGSQGTRIGQPYGVGDTVGCGLDEHAEIFFTRNGVVLHTKIQVPVPDVYPSVGFDRSCTFQFNMAAQNPLTQCKISSFPRTEDEIPWEPKLGKPVGKIKLPAAEPQICGLFSLPQDLIKRLIVTETMACVILETCRAAYHSFSRFFSFVDVHSLCNKVVGFYADTANAWSYSPYSLGFEINKNGKFRAFFRKPGDDTYYRGLWKLSRVHGVSAPILVLKLPQGDERLPRSFEISRLPGLAVSEVKAFQQLAIPRQREFMYKCGVPLEQQVAGKDCCSEIVDGLVDEVWLSGNFHRLGQEVKEAISHRVSRMCMAPPGMTDDQLRIAIANEIANCQEWNASFASICS